jgi:hypothetical protein
MNAICVRYGLGDQGIVVRFSAGSYDFVICTVRSSYRAFQWGSFPCKSGTACRGPHLSSAGIVLPVSPCTVNRSVFYYVRARFTSASAILPADEAENKRQVFPEWQGCGRNMIAEETSDVTS